MTAIITNQLILQQVGSQQKNIVITKDDCSSGVDGRSCSSSSSSSCSSSCSSSSCSSSKVSNSRNNRSSNIFRKDYSLEVKYTMWEIGLNINEKRKHLNIAHCLCTPVCSVWRREGCGGDATKAKEDVGGDVPEAVSPAVFVREVREETGRE